jgi:hypothetical protein
MGPMGHGAAVHPKYAGDDSLKKPGESKGFLVRVALAPLILTPEQVHAECAVEGSRRSPKTDDAPGQVDAGNVQAKFSCEAGDCLGIPGIRSAVGGIAGVVQVGPLGDRSFPQACDGRRSGA